MACRAGGVAFEKLLFGADWKRDVAEQQGTFPARLVARARALTALPCMHAGVGILSPSFLVLVYRRLNFELLQSRVNSGYLSSGDSHLPAPDKSTPTRAIRRLKSWKQKRPRCLENHSIVGSPRFRRAIMPHIIIVPGYSITPSKRLGLGRD